MYNNHKTVMYIKLSSPDPAGQRLSNLGAICEDLLRAAVTW